MFDNLKNLQQLAGLMKNADQIKAEFARLQEELKATRIEAETGGGAVRATVSGTMKVLSIHVDPAMLASLANTDAETDRQLAEDLIVGAVNAAMEKAQRHAAEEMARRGREMGLPVPPGADVSKWFLPGGMGG